MGLQFTTGTINELDSAAVGRSMANQIRDDVVAHAAWDLVEEFDSAGATVHWYVFKCLSTASGLLNDFFVCMGCRASDGAIGMWICEDYNPATNASSHYAPYPTYQQCAYDGLGRAPYTYTLATVFPAGGSGEPQMPSWTPSGTSTKWWLIVDDDRFVVAFNGAVNAFIEMGAYLPLCETEIPLPIMQRWAGTTGFNITRNPAVANVTFYHTSLYWNAWGLGFGGRLDVSDKLNGDERITNEWGMTIYEYNTGDRQVTGWLLGKLKKYHNGSNYPAGISFGDAYVMENRLWVPYLPTDTGLWDTGVAAS